MVDALNAKLPAPRRSGPVLAGTAVLVLLSAAAPAPADTPPPPLRHTTPPPASVTAAIDTLRAACASWPKSRVRAVTPEPTSLSHFDPANGICDVVADPGSAATTLLWVGGGFGAAATVLGLIGFAALRAILVGLWTWRPRARPPNPGTALPW